MHKTLIAIVGPTASGKTKLSIQLAKTFSCEIISADSRQFYKEMNIGTAKTKYSEMEGIPHHFINFISVSENYNAGRYAQDVKNFLSDYFKKKNMAILTGGSGLYISAVLNGLDLIPPSDKKVREQLNEELLANGIESLLRKLEILDTNYYQRVDKNNPRRILRALEVCILSGLPYSSFRNKENGTNEKSGREGVNKNNFRIIKIGLELPREKLYEGINKRVDVMMEQGLLKEANDLLPFRNYNALQTVGYEELFDYFDKMKLANSTDANLLECATALIKRNSRRYAKRQMTWFRKDKEINWFNPEETEKILEFILRPFSPL